MKKITIVLLCLLSFAVFAQSKSTGNILLNSSYTANFTLNNTTSKVTLVFTGPSDRWFALGLGVASGFGMQDGDVLLYTTSLTDRNFIGYGVPATDASEDWVIISNPAPVGGVRTLTLERALTNSDPNDLQLPYALTNSIDVAWARPGTATTTVQGHSSRGFATGTFTPVLGVEDFSLNATAVYPNPSSGEFYIKTKTSLTKVNLYNQTGALVKTINVNDDSKEVEVNVSGIQSGVYFLELLNSSEKSWKKVIVN